MAVPPSGTLTAFSGIPVFVSTDSAGTSVVPMAPYTNANGLWIPRPSDGNGVPYNELRGSLPALDSTTTPLAASGTYTTANPFLLSPYRSIVGSAYADQDGTLLIEQSPDGTNWDVQSTVTVTGGSPTGGFTIDIINPYGRLVYTNGATAQTMFRLYAWGKNL